MLIDSKLKKKVNEPVKAGAMGLLRNIRQMVTTLTLKPLKKFLYFIPRSKMVTRLNKKLSPKCLMKCRTRSPAAFQSVLMTLGTHPVFRQVIFTSCIFSRGNWSKNWMSVEKLFRFDRSVMT